MENKGFDKELSEKSKEALQSETWKQVRETMKTETSHFKDAPEIQSFHEAKQSKYDDAYGVTWAAVVKEYLKTAYSKEEAQADVVLWDVTYKVLKRDSVTSFYDAAGNTLFDVENSRLAKEYEFVMKEASDPEDIECQIAKQIEETGEEDLKCSDGVGEDCEKASEEEELDEEKEQESEDGSEPEEDVEEAEATRVDNAKPVKERAKEKLEVELEAAKDKTFAEPVIGYLLKRCEEDLGLAQDVAQEHKTWKKCFDYIYEQARKQAKGNCAAVRDDVVYEWAEDYYHLDDKAETEKKAKKEAERNKKQAENSKKVKVNKTNPTATKPEEKEEVPRQDKPKKKNKDMDGQLDLFSMMGM